MRPDLAASGHRGADANPPEGAVYEGWPTGVKRGTRLGGPWNGRRLAQVTDRAAARLEFEGLSPPGSSCQALPPPLESFGAPPGSAGSKPKAKTGPGHPRLSSPRSRRGGQAFAAPRGRLRARRRERAWP